MKNFIDNLSYIKLFEGLDFTDIKKIYPLLHVRNLRLQKGDILVHPDDIVDYVGVLLSGELSVSKEDMRGTSNLIRKILPHTIFTAEVACTPSMVSPFTISCVTDSDIMTFPYHMLSSKSAIPDEYRCVMLKNILDIMANSNIRQLYKVEILSKKSLRDRIILYLAFQVKRSSSKSFDISFSREELATYLCVDRSALSRELGRMQKEGLIIFNRNHFQIVDDKVCT